MITYKTERQIKTMSKAGKMLHEIITEMPRFVHVDQTTREINEYIDKRITELGGEPGFKRVKGYKWASCICVNEQIVHTPPSERIINDGDVVTVDTGVFLDGLHTDSATTFQVGSRTEAVTRFLETGRKALDKAISQAIVGKNIGHISQAFQEIIEEAGYSVVVELTGHGVGKDLHEDPYVPCFLDRAIKNTLKLQKGMTLALEVMYTMGKGRMKYENDGWSIVSADKSVAACFEHSVAIVGNKPFILT